MSRLLLRVSGVLRRLYEPRCVKRINALLVDQNTVIAEAISFSNPEREMIQIVTAKANQSKRGKPSNFFASFCPFCGVKLNLGSAA